MAWASYWVWGTAAVILAILELLAPSYIFLGFAIGAAALAFTAFVGGSLAGVITSSLPLSLFAFAVLSLLAWFALRAALGRRAGRAKIIDRDINED